MKKKNSKKSKTTNNHTDNSHDMSQTSIFSEVDENGKYPNELARLTLSIGEGRITDVLVANECDLLLNSDEYTSKTKDSSNSEKSIILENADKYDISITPGTEHIWKNLALGKIDLSYAEIGHTMTGQSVLDNDVLVTLLTTYGFDVDDALHFIDDFIKNTENDKLSPIIMISKNISKIMDDIDPIEDI